MSTSDWLICILFFGFIGLVILFGVFTVIDHFAEGIKERKAEREHEAYCAKEEGRRRWEQQKDANGHRAALRKHQDVVKKFADLTSSCFAAWNQLSRIAKTIRGTRTPSFAASVKHDVLQILSVFSIANGTVSKDIGRLYQAILREWMSGRRDLEDCLEDINSFEGDGISLPGTLQVFEISDRSITNNLTSCVAEAYLSLVTAAAKCCDASFAVGAAKAEYIRLLEPYLAGRANDQGAPSEGGINDSCQECNEAYQLLELPFGVGKDAVSDAKKEMAKNFHPDAFGNRRGARVAEEQLKRVNAACDHLLECRLSHEQPVG